MVEIALTKDDNMSNFAKLFRTTEEQSEPIEATVSGCIPAWLEGSLLRVGPGVFDLNSGFEMNHFLDGYSVLFKFSVEHGKVMFSKRYLQSDSFKKAQTIGRPVRGEFATRSYPDPTRGLLSNILAFMMPAIEITDNCHTNIIHFGKRYLALTLTSSLRTINTQDLTTGDLVDLCSNIEAIFLSPIFQKDKNGDFYTISMNTSFKNEEYCFVKFHNSSEINRSQVICRLKPTNKMAMSLSHSFGLTETYLVLIEQPYKLHNYDNIFIEGKTRFYGNIHWKPEQKIIIDVIAHDSPEIYEQTFMKNLRNGKFKMAHQVQTRRYVLPIVDNAEESLDGSNLKESSDQAEAGNYIEVDHEVLCLHPHEFPNLNMKFSGRKYRFYYATGFLFHGEFACSVIKVDVETKAVMKWYAGDGRIPSEPIFVEKPNSTSEDDGLLLVCISTTEPGDTDRLVILDAATMELVSSAKTTCQVPLGCHGLFIANQCE